MFNPLIDRFCESRRRWLIVTGVTFVTGLLTVLPQVDHYLAERDKQAELSEKLVLAGHAAEQLPLYSEREETEERQLAELDRRTVDSKRAPEFRSALVEMVRESGCQLRRINVSTPQLRPWLVGDNPVSGSKDKRADQTPFALEKRSLNLSVSGSTTSIRELLTRVHNEQMISHAKTMDLRPTGRNRNGVQMDLELWYFALTREPQA